MIAIILGSISFQFLDTRRIENKWNFKKNQKRHHEMGYGKKNYRNK